MSEDPPAQNTSVVAVVAVDDGPYSQYAFKKALRVLAKERTHFHLIHVRPGEESEPLDSFSDSVRAYHAHHEQRRHEQCLLVLAKFSALAEAAGVPPTHHTEVELRSTPLLYAPQGDPREEICRYCRDVEADVLVLGSRGQGPAGRMLMGSVSLYCMSHAPCTVMIDHDKDAEEWTAMQAQKEPGTG